MEAKGVNGDDNLNDWAIFCVSWDSSSKGVERFVNDILPTPTLSHAVGSVPDVAIFPFTFWSKAGLADRIGYRGLRNIIENILDNAYHDKEKPQMYLVGHSFGARILSGLINDRLGAVCLPEFRYIDNVKAAVFVLPALVPLNLPDNTNSFVIQSRHDHGNGFLFPVANIPLNSYTSTGTEAIMVRNMCGDKPSLWCGLTFDILQLPFSFAWTAVAVPLNYIYTQGYQMISRNIDYIPDTLAQIPIVQIPVREIDKHSLHRNWGEHYRGAFSLGAINESAGRAVTPTIGMTHVTQPKDINAFLDKREMTSNPLFIDATSVIKEGLYGEDMEGFLGDYLFSWADPVGSHQNFMEPKIMSAIYYILNNNYQHIETKHKRTNKKCISYLK
jgi:hypothetical protein